MDNRNVTLEGKLGVSPFSGGWILESEDGIRYPLKGRIPSTFRAGDPVSVRGRLRPDLASTDMTGTVLEVNAIEKHHDQGVGHATP